MKTVLITGATSGIGVATARALAADGWSTVLWGRDQRRLEAAAASVGSCETTCVDLGDLDAVRREAERARDGSADIDAVVCNAGIMDLPKRQSGAAGHELQLTVNHLSHYVLTAKLMPRLRASPSGGRVVWVSSVRHRGADPADRTPWDPEIYDGRRAYAASKAWNLAYALWLDNALKRDVSGVRSVAAHPGWAATSIQRTAAEVHGADWQARTKAAATRWLAQSAEAGARPVVDACVGGLPDAPTYLGPGGPLELRGRTSAPARVSRLAADERYQSWVASRSAELTLTSLPV
jgi:NAD(P)-dependent dehydrogenase (short-subunit alcohol dehydrogenase family)